MSGPDNCELRIVSSISEIDAAQWDCLANPDASIHNPFVAHAFLKALEEAGTVGGRSGWQPRHILLQAADGRLVGAMPAYLKTHSQGEYIFDHGWAEAYERAGGRYYPKLLAAVPFTPVPGPRLLVPAGPEAAARERQLASGAIALAERLGLSSVHINFLSPEVAARLAPQGFLLRTGQQYHWTNQGYTSFDDFLAALASRKRKAVRKERAEALAGGLTVEWVSGPDITEAHWDAFFAFYMDTGGRKWGRPYLNRHFFSVLGQSMSERCLLVLVRSTGGYIAGALNLIGGDCLYGRYWGATEHRPFLHFEVCYYQAIEFAISRKLARVEAGAQGEHKLARGYMPTPIHSVHWIADPALRRAVARFLVEERSAMAEQREMLAEYGPYRKTPEPEDT